MSKWFKIGTVATFVALVALMALGAGAAFAQGPVTTPPGLGLHLGGQQSSLVTIAAQTLGIERTALVAELNSGKTIADVAKAKNVAVSKIVDAVTANHTALLKQAVADKRITQAQMDAELAQMKSNLETQVSSKWSPRGFGMGAGRGAGLGRGAGAGLGAGFVDANNDGVCDNCGASRPAGQSLGPRWSR